MIINQQKVEKAIRVLERLETDYPNGYPNEFKGDISSFGASIIQAGLLPTVLFFSEGDLSRATSNQNEDESTKLRRARLMGVIFEVLELSGHASYNKARPLLDYVRQNLINANAILESITEAALAVKVALRAFKFAEKKGNAAIQNNTII